ncbi:putative MFS transporter [Mycena vulgaris]|nr:putative MFS transporter [Mycena vulgaris]
MDSTVSSEEKALGAAGLPVLKTANTSSASLDKAIVYLDQHADSQSDSDAVDHALLVRKIDRHIYAAVMGLNADLKLVGNDFNNAASAMYIANLIAEIPTGYIVQKVRPGKWVGFNMILWGVVTACTAAVTNYRGLVATRVMIGILEAATAPCLMLITGMWYTKSEAIIRFAIWYCGLGIAQMLGSLISWGFQQVTHEALSGWRIMFLVLGLVTFVAGVWALFYMPDSPMDVSWLTEAEKRVAIERVAVNQTGIKNTHFKWQHLRELVTDPQIWLLGSLITITSLTSGVISFYSSTLIRNFGFSPGEVPSGLLAGVYLVNMQTVTLFLVFCLATANVAGQTKRVAANALISGAFSIGNIIGPQLFKPKDAPQFIPAKTILLVTAIVTSMIAAALRVYYGWQNKIRDAAEEKERESGDVKEVANIEWLNLTDRENKTFRYKY